MNLIFGIPVIVLPFVILWDAPRENRSRLDAIHSACGRRRPIPAGSGWWQYGLADTRYTSGNPWTFALEVVGVITGITVFAMWTRLTLAPESRIRCLWIAFAGVAVLVSSTAVYFLAEVGNGFNDIGQGPFGLGFKFDYLTRREAREFAAR